MKDTRVHGTRHARRTAHGNGPPRTAASAAVWGRFSARGHLYADLAKDDADALLAFHLADSPAPRDAQDADDATLPLRHPVRQLVREAAWIITHATFAA